MNPLPECCFPHSAPIPHQFVMKVYIDTWIYVTEKFVNMGNIELYEGVLRYEKADYPPIPNFIYILSPLSVRVVSRSKLRYYITAEAAPQEISALNARFPPGACIRARQMRSITAEQQGRPDFLLSRHAHKPGGARPWPRGCGCDVQRGCKVQINYETNFFHVGGIMLACAQ